MSCTLGCILDGECARTSQPEPIIAGANRWTTGSSGAGQTFFKTAGFNRSPTPPLLSITCYNLASASRGLLVKFVFGSH